MKCDYCNKIFSSNKEFNIHFNTGCSVRQRYIFMKFLIDDLSEKLKLKSLEVKSLKNKIKIMSKKYNHDTQKKSIVKN